LETNDSSRLPTVKILDSFSSYQYVNFVHFVDGKGFPLGPPFGVGAQRRNALIPGRLLNSFLLKDKSKGIHRYREYQQWFIISPLHYIVFYNIILHYLIYRLYTEVVGSTRSACTGEVSAVIAL